MRKRGAAMPSRPEILYGVHPVGEAIKAKRRRLTTIYLTREPASGRLEWIVAHAEAHRIPVEVVAADKLASMTDTDHHQGIAAAVGPYPFVALERVLDAGNSPVLLLLLDHVLDVQNFGALIRTALGVGVDGVVICRDRAASATPAVCKASAGAMEHVRMVRVTNLVQTIQELKTSGVWITGLERKAPQSIFKSDLTGALALVIGGEEKGLRPLVRRQCDFLVSIPQTGPVESLNASVAGAVALYEAFRQRTPGEMATISKGLCPTDSPEG
jgi:23S rRNA (guanosine2251-2'-O)-methyltransferase